MTAVAVGCLVALVACVGLSFARVIWAEGLADRAIALDTATACLVSGIAVTVAWSGDGVAIDVVLALGLLGFLATVTIARFMGRKGA